MILASRHTSGRSTDRRPFIILLLCLLALPLAAAAEKVNHGIVEGLLISGERQGNTAAGLAASILRGEPPAFMDVAAEGPNRNTFDHGDLARFQLNVSKPPPESGVINMSQGSNHHYGIRYGMRLLAIIAGFLTLLCLVVFLVTNNRKRVKTEKLLTETKDKYLGIFNDTSVALLVEDFSGLVDDLKKIESEAGSEYRQYFSREHSLLVELSRKIIIRDANPAALTLYSASTKEELAGSLSRIQSRTNRNEFIEFLIAILEKKGEYTVETVNRTLSGEDVNLILRVKMPTSYDNFHTILVSIVDITERKRAEQALIDSENRFRSAFNSTAAGMALLSIEGQYLKVNRVICSLLGYSEEELLGKSWMDVTHPDDITMSRENVEKLKQHENSEPIEKRYLNKKGEAVWVLFSGSLIFDSKGEPAYQISQFQDITRRKEAEAKLVEQKERYRKYFEDDLSGIFVIDNQGILLTCNQSFRAMLGIDDATAIGEIHFYNFFRESDGYTRFFNTLVLQKKLERFELLLKKFDDTPVTVVINAIGRFTKSGKLLEIQGYIIDVTQKKILEAQLLQAQKLESIGTMAGGVAHDFNNLLMGVLGNTSLLLLDKNDSDPDYRRLKNIEEFVKNGSSLTRQLLGFAKGGKYEVKASDINEIISRNAYMFSQTHKEIEIELRLEAGERVVDVDQSQIDQVMYNLYVNAWQAMDEGGKISIWTSNVLLDGESVAARGVKAGKFVKIEVADNGSGMDQKTLKRIFDPFFTTKEISRGTGLGLASSYGIIQNHYGIIEAESELGVGTRFFIYLPVSPQAFIDKGRIQSKEQMIKGRENVLIVDDEEVIIEVASQMLKALGYEVETAGSGREAVEKFQQIHEKVDLVILDMIMPGMGGGETFDALKKIDDEVKVLLSSGYSLDQKAGAILQRGCRGFLQKPFDLHALSEKVRQILDLSR